MNLRDDKGALPIEYAKSSDVQAAFNTPPAAVVSPPSATKAALSTSAGKDGHMSAAAHASTPHSPASERNKPGEPFSSLDYALCISYADCFVFFLRF